ncbi:MAG: U32 family peptidase [Lachnospiraceae bacterium]|nr:U32 family peptidase [Lachnospiraceae bacterium]
MNDKNIRKKPELLAPAGSFDNMKAVISAGADAVYMGGKSFGARAYADNPDTDGVIEAIRFCHIRNKKLYLTVNTLLKEDELNSQLYDYIKPFYEAGLDAVIVQDLGVMDYISKHFPGLDIHLSTQCSLTMAEGVKGLTSMLKTPSAVTRLVPARELSLEELKTMRRDTDLEMEVFIHGALCYCYSGQCLLSSLAGGRSGNRGRCAQPCRRLYKVKIGEQESKGYFLSPKDMCTIEHIPELIEAGIDSFKIEGRMKSGEYGAGVVAAYRKAIDRYYDSKTEYSVDPGERSILSEIYNRGGFNTGYLFSHNGKDMMSTERPGHYGVKVGEVSRTSSRKAFIKVFKTINPGDVLEIRSSQADAKPVYEFTSGAKYMEGAVFDVLTMKDRLAAGGMGVYRTRNQSLLDAISDSYIKTTLRQPVDIDLVCKNGEALKLTLSTQNDKAEDHKVNVSITGNVVEVARNAASTLDALKAQVSKLGNTDYVARNVTVRVDNNVFVQVGELNRLRREAVEALNKKLCALYERNLKLDENSGSSCESDNTSGLNEKESIIAEYQDALDYSVTYSAYIKTFKQLKNLINADTSGIINDIYIDIDEEKAGEIIEFCNESSKKLYFVLPRIIRAGYYKKVFDFCKEYKDKCSFIASNYEAVNILKEVGADYRTDYNIYSMNSTAANAIGTLHTIPFELNEKEFGELVGRDGSGEMVIYGLLPAMVSAQCVGKTVTGECKYRGPMKMTDEKGYTFTAHQECKYCYNVIYNSAVLNLMHRHDNLVRSGCRRFGLRFTFESESEIKLVVRCLDSLINGEKYIFPDEIMGLKLTNGHYMRGVE